MPPPTVTVSYPLVREITDYAEYTGRTAAVDSVQVRARVSGYLQKVNFKDGSEVQAGEVLYVIDPRPYQAAVRQAQAQVNLQQAQLKYNEAVYQRNVRLMNAGQAVDVETVQQSLSQRDVTRAQLAAAQASLEQAQLNLEWTDVRAPINGRLSRTLVTVGNLVIADQTFLTTLVSMDPIYAYFDADEPTVLRVRQLIREGKFKSAREPGVRVPVYLGLSIERGYPHEGYLDFINNQIDPSTGTLQVRGVFTNPKPPVGDRLLSPGLFVRIRVPTGPPHQALLVNQRAVGTDQNLTYVYVLNDQDEVVRREVALGSQQGDLQEITQGLRPDERVLINGLQLVQPGTAVTAKLVPMPTTATEAQPSGTPGGTAPPATTQPRVAPNMQQSPPSTGTRQ
jgi:RND family efflux transporter MFP subunit